MAGLCEGSNEPPGSLKATKHQTNSALIAEENFMPLFQIPTQALSSAMGQRVIAAARKGLLSLSCPLETVSDRLGCYRPFSCLHCLLDFYEL
ncbi:hypothetical protein ANN_01959, partial [Periplaneta americana]